VCGPISPTPLGGNKNILTFTCDFSEKTWVYLLKEKEEVFNKFREFKILVEKQSCCYLKKLRTNNRGEYTSK